MTHPRRRKALVALALAALLAALSVVAPATYAATPAGDTLSTAHPVITFTSGPFTASNQSGQALFPPVCTIATPCDTYVLTVTVPAGYDATHAISVGLTWPNPADEFDLYIFNKTDNQYGKAGDLTNASPSPVNPQVAILPAVSGVYSVTVVAVNAINDTATGTATFITRAPGTVVGTTHAPTYQNYTPPSNLTVRSAGEPSIGVNWKSGNVMYLADLQTLRVAFSDANSPVSTTPATATWKDVSYVLTSQTTLDPILFTDHTTGRTIVAQLAGTSSLSAFTDNDGGNGMTGDWIPSEGGSFDSGVDHETVGGGPFAAPLNVISATAPYTHGVYYCSQDIATAFCAFSGDGGATYGSSVPIYTQMQCGGIHGHVMVGPDGTAYVPNHNCNNGRMGMTVSTDNGTTWTVRTITGSIEDAIGSDPSIGIGRGDKVPGGVIYYGYQNGDGRPHVAVLTDHGQTIINDQDVGANIVDGQTGLVEPGARIQNTAFPATVAGDDDRASMAFFGTPTEGNQNNADFTGVWHLYIATTIDRGQTWKTVDVTPNDPVQRGNICTLGIACNGGRNLLDFMGATVDKFGRVLVGYGDGCINTCDAGGDAGTNPNTNSDSVVIARQTSGPRLFAQYDQPAGTGTGGTTPTATPEPGSGALYTTGVAALLGMFLVTRRRRRIGKGASA